MTGSAIEVDGVSLRFGRIQALDALSLRVESGTVMGVVGLNGAGKTTLLDVVCGLVRPDAGRVTVLGQDALRPTPSLRARMGVVPQETALYEELSAIENLALPAALYGVKDPERRMGEVLALVGLTARARDRVATFSGGMQRRLAIARALLHDPALLVFDEPTLGVDAEARHVIWNRVRALRAAGRTVLLATNYLDEAEALCDRVAVLREGRLLVNESPAALSVLTGRCLELECAEDEVARVRAAVEQGPGVLRTREDDGRLIIYFDASASTDDLVRRAMGVIPLRGFRVRSPDLVEVFRAASEAQA